MRRIVVALMAVALLASTGCVGKKKYDAVVQDRNDLKVELGKLKKKHAETKADLKSQIDAREKKIAELENKVASLEKKKAKLAKDLEEAEGTLQMYETKKGSLEDKLDTTREELAKLREQQRQQQKRLQKYRDLAKKLAETFKSDQLSVKVRDGKMVIEMSDDVLFDSGQARVNKSGKEVLEQLANVLADMKDREFLIAGHTDDVPISSSKFSDNWDLSSSRAANVVRFLSDKGVSPGQLAAAGFSKYDPIASNETDEGKAKNRRIEIVLMPKVEELPNLPKDLFEES